MNFFLLRLKLLIRNKISCICYVLCLAVCAGILLNLTIFADESSAFPIGMIDEDRTSLSKELIEKVKNSDSIRVVEGSRDELDELLKDGYINSIFTVKRGYEEAVTGGNGDKMIGVICARDDRISTIVCDIVASDVVYQLSCHKSYIYYNDLPDSTLSEDEYSAYIAAREADKDFKFSFDASFVSTDSAKTSKKGEAASVNIVVYISMIGGLTAFLFMPVIFCSCNALTLEAEKGILRRRFTVKGSRVREFLFECLAIIVYLLPFALVVALIGPGKGILLFLLNCVFVSVLVFVFYFIAYATRKTYAYQAVSVALTILLAVCGFVGIFSGVTGLGFLKATPVSLYIEFFRRIYGY